MELAQTNQAEWVGLKIEDISADRSVSFHVLESWSFHLGICLTMPQHRGLGP